LLFASIATAADPEIDEDERLLRNAGIKADAAGLLDFFRGRTLGVEEGRRLEGLVRQLGSENFERREEATKELIQRAEPALPFLRRVLRDPDAEVARRALLCMEEIISRSKGPALPLAAARRLARLAPPQAVAVLLAYLPFADDAAVEEEAAQALAALFKPAEEDLLWKAALASTQPAVRAAAARVLAAKGNSNQRLAVRPLLTDPDPGVRFRAADGLVSARHSEAVGTLIRLLDDGPIDQALQSEEVLLLLAENKGPGGSVLEGGAGGRTKCRLAWEAWWDRHASQVDLARAAERHQGMGLTLCVEYNTGRVWECGRDGRLRWELTGLQGPMEAQVLPGGRVLIAESNNHTVSERDLQGNVRWQRRLDAQPTGCQRLPNGHVFVSTYNGVQEFDREGKEVFSFKLPRGSNAICKHRNGHVLYALESEIVEADSSGRNVRSIPLPKNSMYVGIQDLPGDRFLLANSSTGQVLEVDAAGKVVWSASVPGACGVSRLANGHTLVGVHNRVVELNRDGHTVWERATAGYIRRVHRR
jgi:hypothetical protein